jgi:hypothetical protein
MLGLALILGAIPERLGSIELASVFGYPITLWWQSRCFHSRNIVPEMAILVNHKESPLGTGFLVGLVTRPFLPRLTSSG